jgi:hypothetical protein
MVVKRRNYSQKYRFSDPFATLTCSKIMNSQEILDHFPSEEPTEGFAWNLMVIGLLLGIPAGFVHYFFFSILPPSGGIGWLKAIVLFSNQAIFLIMILSYLARQLRLDSTRRQFTFGGAFVLSSVLTLPLIVRVRYFRSSSNMEDLSEMIVAMEQLLLLQQLGIWFLLLALALCTLLLIFLIRRYGQAFRKLAKRTPS